MTMEKMIYDNRKMTGYRRKTIYDHRKMTGEKVIYQNSMVTDENALGISQIVMVLYENVSGIV